MIKISTKNAPTPAGHYSQAIVHDNIVYISGQIPIDPNKSEKIVGSIEKQTEQVLQNLGEILKAANSDLNLVLKTTIYISDMELWDRVNKVYSIFFKDHRPARVIVPTKELHFGFQIELEATAVVRSYTSG
jgi:2-iminobutanoate/2-iminopropanoate deaminase